MMTKSPKDELSRGLRPWFQRPPWSYAPNKWSSDTSYTILYPYLYLVGALLVEKIEIKEQLRLLWWLKKLWNPVEVGSFSHDELYKKQVFRQIGPSICESQRVSQLHFFWNPASGSGTAIGQSLDRRWGGSCDWCKSIPVKQWHRLDFWFLRKFLICGTGRVLSTEIRKRKDWSDFCLVSCHVLFTEMTRPAFNLAQAVYTI